MTFDGTWLLERMMLLVPLLLSLAVHEWAHAWSAWRLGDDTAAQMGRMTLDPLAHIDPVGTLLLPLLGVPFGWAKPVPVDPTRFRPEVSMSRGLVLTAAAGPISNLVLALLCTLALGLLRGLGPSLLQAEPAVASLLWSLIQLNWALAVFNALPIPPLDGSRVADALMPEPLRPAWDRLASAGPVALLAVVALPQLLGFSLFAWIQHLSQMQLQSLVKLISA
jgi:Zn-dependent protease